MIKIESQQIEKDTLRIKGEETDLLSPTAAPTTTTTTPTTTVNHNNSSVSDLNSNNASLTTSDTSITSAMQQQHNNSSDSNTSNAVDPTDSTSLSKDDPLYKVDEPLSIKQDTHSNTISTIKDQDTNTVLGDNFSSRSTSTPPHELSKRPSSSEPLSHNAESYKAFKSALAPPVNLNNNNNNNINNITNPVNTSVRNAVIPSGINSYNTYPQKSRNSTTLSLNKTIDSNTAPNLGATSERRQTFPFESKTGFTDGLQNNALKKQHSLNTTATKEIQRMKFKYLSRDNKKQSKKSSSDDKEATVGRKVLEGDDNYVTAYNMLTGIRVAVSRCSGIMKPLTDEDFKASKKLTFDITGTELTPSSKYDFKFKDYSPNVFRELRDLFGLDQADYLVSLTAKYILSEVDSPGKSGSFFYYSRDCRFIIKTIHRAEHLTLRRMLKNYYEHVRDNPNTLVSQFYGLHRLKMPLRYPGKRKIYFIVMNNLFPPNKELHKTYDLKGSLWKRETIIPSEDANQENEKLLSKKAKRNPILKDQNWLENKEVIHLGSKKREKFVHQLESDVKFLQKSNIMDYSLLLGVHDIDIGNVVEQKFSVFAPKDITNREDINSTAPIPLENIEHVPIHPNDNQVMGVNSESELFKQKFYFYSYENGFRATNENNEALNEIYYLGIIDCLTNYSMVKRLETFVKSFYQNRKEISAVPATEYGNRFLKFIKQKSLPPEIKK